MKKPPKGYCTPEEILGKPMKIILVPPNFFFKGPQVMPGKQMKALSKCLRNNPINKDRIWLWNLTEPIETIEWNCKGFLGYKSPRQ